MADDIDLIRSAKLLVDNLGREGAIERAKVREAELLEADDHAGAAAWRLILRYIEDLPVAERKKPTAH